MNEVQTRAAQWLRASRATETQETLAADIERVTGWHITRDRYSKYESGSIPMGRAVLARFVGYWATRGKPGPESVMGSAGLDDTSRSADPALIEALTAQTKAITALVERLDLMLPSEKVREMLSWAAEYMPAESLSPDPRPDPDGSRARS